MKGNGSRASTSLCNLVLEAWLPPRSPVQFSSLHTCACMSCVVKQVKTRECRIGVTVNVSGAEEKVSSKCSSIGHRMVLLLDYTNHCVHTKHSFRLKGLWHLPNTVYFDDITDVYQLQLRGWRGSSNQSEVRRSFLQAACQSLPVWDTSASLYVCVWEWVYEVAKKWWSHLMNRSAPHTAASAFYNNV